MLAAAEQRPAGEARRLAGVRALALPLAALVLGAVGTAWSGTPAGSPITFPGVGAHGVFDPSLERDGDRLWMSYSAVEAPKTPACAATGSSTIERIETRLAWSEDGGRTWTDAGRVNAAEDVCLPEPALLGTWVNEVSTLVRDETAPKAERWKLIWHRYLWVSGSSQPNRRFDQSWIAVRAAATPGKLAAAPARKLFVGMAYDTRHDASGKPAARLTDLHADLADCAVATEPGALSTPDGLYVALSCRALDAARSRLVLLRLSRGHWRYVGTALDGKLSRAAGSEQPMTAAEPYLSGTKAFLIATRVSAPDDYSGCSVFTLDLRTAKVGTKAGKPHAVLDVKGEPPFRGACGYDPAATRSGILLSQVALQGETRVFRIVRTGKRP